MFLICYTSLYFMISRVLVYLTRIWFYSILFIATWIFKANIRLLFIYLFYFVYCYLIYKVNNCLCGHYWLILACSPHPHPHPAPVFLLYLDFDNFACVYLCYVYCLLVIFNLWHWNLLETLVIFFCFFRLFF